MAHDINLNFSSSANIQHVFILSMEITDTGTRLQQAYNSNVIWTKSRVVLQHRLYCTARTMVTYCTQYSSLFFASTSKTYTLTHPVGLHKHHLGSKTKQANVHSALIKSSFFPTCSVPGHGHGHGHQKHAQACQAEDRSSSSSSS